MRVRVFFSLPLPRSLGGLWKWRLRARTEVCQARAAYIHLRVQGIHSTICSQLQSKENNLAHAIEKEKIWHPQSVSLEEDRDSLPHTRSKKRKEKGKNLDSSCRLNVWRLWSLLRSLLLSGNGVEINRRRRSRSHIKKALRQNLACSFQRL